MMFGIALSVLPSCTRSQNKMSYHDDFKYISFTLSLESLYSPMLQAAGF